jgi:hypothetical protein
MRIVIVAENVRYWENGYFGGGADGGEKRTSVFDISLRD